MSLKRVLSSVNQYPKREKQKLLLIFNHGSTPGYLEYFTISWLEKKVQPEAVRFMNKGAGCTHSVNTAILCLPTKNLASVFPL